MMGRSLGQHDRIIESARAVSKAFLALELARNFNFVVNDERTNLSELLSKIRYIRDTEVTITINKKSYNITCLEPTAQQRNENPHINYFKISRVGGNEKSNPLRHAGDYKSDDIDEVMSVFTNATFGIKIGSDSPYISLETDGQHIALGGPDKESLYASHLSVITAIIDHLHEPDVLAKNLNNILIAYPTGSGKTFIQAVWFLILYHARVSGVFALPENSLHQYINDFKRLLPSYLVEKIISINSALNHANACARPKNDENLKGKDELYQALPEADNTEQSLLLEQLSSLKLRPAQPTYFIGSHSDALSTFLPHFLETENLVFCIDEQHKAVEIEAQKIALLKLAETTLCMFLTATPDEATYKVCGKPTAIMPKKSFSELHVIKAKSFDDYRKESKSGRAIVMAVVNAIEPAPVSTAAALMTELPYVVATRQIAGKDQTPERQARWNFTTMLSRRALICAGESVDDLVNISRFAHRYSGSATEATASQVTHLYSDGNERDRLYTFHITRQKKVNNQGGSTDTADRDTEHATNYLKMKKKILDKVTPEVILNNEDLHIPVTLLESANHSIFNGLNEILIRAVLAYNEDPARALANFKMISSKDLNARRLSDLTDLTDDFQHKLAEVKHCNNVHEYFTNLLTYHSDHNTAGIDSVGADKSAGLLERMLTEAFLQDHACLQKIVDNWNIDHTFKKICFQKPKFRNYFSEFANNQRTVFIMDGMDDAETPIESGRPFRKFDITYVSIRNDDGSLNPNAKKRNLSMVEYFDPNAIETHFTPDYYDPGVTEFHIDNYFRLGLIGFLVSNRKSEAFNDRGLTNVIPIISHNGDKNNKPSQVIQQIGRNRDLDPTQISMVAQVYAKDADPIINITSLKESDDFLPELFKAERRYERFLIFKLGKSIAAEIKSWFTQSTDGKEQVSPALFRKTVLQTLLQKMRYLNIQNNHQLKKTKAEFKRSIAIAQKSIKDIINKLKHSFSATVVTKILNFGITIISAFFSLRRIPAAIAFYRKASADKKRLAAMKADDPNFPKLRLEVAYAKVIRAHSLNQTYQNTFIAIQFQRSLERKIAILKNTVLDDPVPILNDATNHLMNELMLENILPLLVRFFPKEHQLRLLSIAQSYQGWSHVIYKHRDLFKELGKFNQGNLEGMTAPFSKLATAVFSEIPELQADITAMESNDYLAIATSAKSALLQPINDLTNDRSYLLEQLEIFLKTTFPARIKICLPNRYSYLINQILNTDNHAGEFASVMVNHYLSSGAKSPQFDLEESFTLFRNHFKEQYPALNDINELNSITQHAQSELPTINLDLVAIMTGNQTNLTENESDHLISPVKNNKLSKFKNSVTNKLSQGKSAVHFISKKSSIQNELATYFNTSFLDKMTLILPQQEYGLLSNIFNNINHCQTFATYLYKNAIRIQRENSNDANQLIGYLKDCFKDTPLSVDLNQFRSPDQIQQSAAQVTSLLTTDIQMITQNYALHLRQSVSRHYAELFKQPDYIDHLGELLHITGTGVQPDETNHQILSRLMNQPHAPNAESFAADMVNRYETWKGENNDDQEPPIDKWLSAHFSGSDANLNYKATFTHKLAEAGFKALSSMQNQIAQFVDYAKLSKLAAAHLGELFTQPDFINLLNFYLKDLNEGDIAAILRSHSTNVADCEIKAAELMQLKKAISSGNSKDIPAAFFLPSHHNHHGSDIFSQDIQSTPLYRAATTLATLMQDITSYQCYYHRTSNSGGARFSLANASHSDGNDIWAIRVPAVERDSLGDICWSLNFMQAQLKSAPAQDRINAFTDKYSIDTYQRASDHLIKPFSTVYNASNVGLALSKGLKKIGTRVRNFFSRKQNTVVVQDESLSTDIASSLQQRQPLTWNKVKTHLDKHAVDPARHPHQDVFDKSIRRLDAVAAEQSQPKCLLFRHSHPLPAMSSGSDSNRDTPEVSLGFPHLTN